MSFVVSNARVFKEFDTIEDAKKFFNETAMFDLKIYERDMFGNLTEANADAVEIKQPIKEIKAEPIKTQPSETKAQIGTVKEEDTTTKYIKYGVIGLMSIIILFILFVLILPMILEFVKVWEKI